MNTDEHIVHEIIGHDYDFLIYLERVRDDLIKYHNKVIVLSGIGMPSIKNVFKILVVLSNKKLINKIYKSEISIIPNLNRPDETILSVSVQITSSNAKEFCE